MKESGHCSLFWANIEEVNNSTKPLRQESPYKVNSVPLQARSGPEGSRKLRFPDFMTTAQNGGKVVSLTHQPSLPPVNTPGTHLC